MTNHKFSRRGFLKVSAVASVGTILAACGAPPTAPAQPTAAPEATKAPENTPEPKPTQPEPTPTFRVDSMGSGQTVINMWDGIGASDGDVLSSIIKSFAEKNTDVSVKRQIMPWGTYFDKLTAALVAGSGGPDLFILWHSVLPQYARGGFLFPIGDAMFEDKLLTRDDFLPQLLDAVTIDGKTWDLPFDNYGVGVYVNMDLLEKAGLSYDKPPKDQAEFLEYARKLTTDKNGKHPGESGFDPKNVDVWGWIVDWPRATIQPSLYQWNSDVISRDYPPKVLINSEGSKAATQFWVDAIYKEYISPNPTGFNIAEAWVNGKIAMWPMGSWMFNFHQQQKLNVKLWPYPKVGPDRGATLMWSHTLAVPKSISADKLKANKRLIQYLSDNSDIWTEKAGMPCARISKRAGLMDKVWTLPVFDKQFKAEGIMEFGSPKFNEIDAAVGAAWSSALSKEKSVNEALDTAGELITKALTI